MAKAYLVVLRHRLYLQTQDAQLVHYPWHAVGHHTEVFGTYKHACCLGELGHLLHCLLIPELVVTTIEVVVVETVEIILVIVPQLLVDEVELNSNAWVELVRVLVVAQEEHITDKGIQSVAQVLILHSTLAFPSAAERCFFILHSLVPRFHLALGVVFWLHLIALVVEAVKEYFLHLVGILVEYAVESPVGDERTGVTIFIKAQSVTLYLLAGHAE